MTCRSVAGRRRREGSPEGRVHAGRVLLGLVVARLVAGAFWLPSAGAAPTNGYIAVLKGSAGSAGAVDPDVDVIDAGIDTTHPDLNAMPSS